MYFLSVKRNVITAFTISNSLDIWPRERVWRKRMHAVKWNVNERKEFVGTTVHITQDTPQITVERRGTK